MKETELIWFNGKLVKWYEAKVHVLTHALHYGRGVFEGNPLILIMFTQQFILWFCILLYLQNIIFYIILRQ